MPCVKRVYKDTMGAGPLVSSQERRAAVFLRMNRGSTGFTADKLVVIRRFCSPIGLNVISFVRASEESSRTVVFDSLESKRVGNLLGEQTRRRPAPPRPAPPCPAPPRLFPDHLWYIRVLDSTNAFISGNNLSSAIALEPRAPQVRRQRHLTMVHDVASKVVILVL